MNPVLGTGATAAREAIASLRGSSLDPFGAHGGDWAAPVSIDLARLEPERVAALHQTPNERTHIDRRRDQGSSRRITG